MDCLWYHCLSCLNWVEGSVWIGGSLTNNWEVDLFVFGKENLTSFLNKSGIFVLFET